MLNKCLAATITDEVNCSSFPSSKLDLYYFSLEPSHRFDGLLLWAVSSQNTNQAALAIFFRVVFEAPGLKYGYVI